MALFSSLISFYTHAGIGAQFNIDNEVKILTAEQKTKEDALQQSPPGSPKSILRKKNAPSQEDGWILGLLKCLQT